MNVGFLNNFEFLYNNLGALKKKYDIETNTEIIGEVKEADKKAVC